MDKTNHAQARLQQRAISNEAVDALIAYGERRRRKGADIYFLNKQSRRRVANALGPQKYRRIERSLNSYLVIADDGCLITAAHRHQRLKF